MITVGNSGGKRMIHEKNQNNPPKIKHVSILNSYITNNFIIIKFLYFNLELLRRLEILT